MRKDSKKAERLYDVLMENAEVLADLINGAPAWRPKWSDKAADEFLKLFEKRRPPATGARPRFTEP
jgi:hypothetical protein